MDSFHNLVVSKVGEISEECSYLQEYVQAVLSYLNTAADVVSERSFENVEKKPATKKGLKEKSETKTKAGFAKYSRDEKLEFDSGNWIKIWKNIGDQAVYAENRRSDTWGFISRRFLSEKEVHEGRITTAEDSYRKGNIELNFKVGDEIELFIEKKSGESDWQVGRLLRTDEVGYVHIDDIYFQPVYAIPVKRLIEQDSVNWIEEVPSKLLHLIWKKLTYLLSITRTLSEDTMPLQLNSLYNRFADDPKLLYSSSVFIGTVNSYGSNLAEQFGDRYHLEQITNQTEGNKGDDLTDKWFVVKGNDSNELEAALKLLKCSSLDYWVDDMLIWLLGEYLFLVDSVQIKRLILSEGIGYKIQLAPFSCFALVFVVHEHAIDTVVIQGGLCHKSQKSIWQSDKIEMTVKKWNKFDWGDAIELRSRLLQPCLGALTQYWVSNADLRVYRNQNAKMQKSQAAEVFDYWSSFWSSLHLTKILVDAIRRCLVGDETTHISFATASVSKVEDELFNGDWLLSLTDLLLQLIKHWFNPKSVEEALLETVLEKFLEGRTGSVTVAAIASGQMVILYQLFGTYLISQNVICKMGNLPPNEQSDFGSGELTIPDEDYPTLMELLPYATGVPLTCRLQKVDHLLEFKCSPPKTVSIWLRYNKQHKIDAQFELVGNNCKNISILFFEYFEKEAQETELEVFAKILKDIKNRRWSMIETLPAVFSLKQSDTLRKVHPDIRLRDGDSIFFQDEYAETTSLFNVPLLYKHLVGVFDNFKAMPLPFSEHVNLSNAELNQTDDKIMAVKLPYYKSTFLLIEVQKDSFILKLFIPPTEEKINGHIIDEIKLENFTMDITCCRKTIDEFLISRVTSYFSLWDDRKVPLHLIEILLKHFNRECAALLLRAWPIMRYHQACEFLYVGEWNQNLELDFRLDVYNCFDLLQRGLRKNDKMIMELAARFIHDSICFGQIQLARLRNHNGQLIIELLKVTRLVNKVMESELVWFLWIAHDKSIKEVSLNDLKRHCSSMLLNNETANISSEKNNSSTLIEEECPQTPSVCYLSTKNHPCILETALKHISPKWYPNKYLFDEINCDQFLTEQTDSQPKSGYCLIGKESDSAFPTGYDLMCITALMEKQFGMDIDILSDCSSTAYLIKLLQKKQDKTIDQYKYFVAVFLASGRETTWDWPLVFSIFNNWPSIIDKPKLIFIDGDECISETNESSQAPNELFVLEASCPTKTNPFGTAFFGAFCEVMKHCTDGINVCDIAHHVINLVSRLTDNDKYVPFIRYNTLSQPFYFCRTANRQLLSLMKRSSSSNKILVTPVNGSIADLTVSDSQMLVYGHAIFEVFNSNKLLLLSPLSILLVRAIINLLKGHKNLRKIALTGQRAIKNITCFKTVQTVYQRTASVYCDIETKASATNFNLLIIGGWSRDDTNYSPTTTETFGHTMKFRSKGDSQITMDQSQAFLYKNTVYGFGSFYPSAQLISLSLPENEQCVLTEHPCAIAHLSSCQLIGTSLLLSCGGEGNNHTILKTTHIVDLETFEWMQLPEMLEYRRWHSLVEFNGRPLATGGGYECFVHGKKTTEYFVRGGGKDLWVKGPAFQEGRSHHASVVFNELVVIAGGISEDDDWTNTVQILDERMDKWQWGPSLKQKRDLFPLVVFDDKLFAVAGSGGVANGKEIILRTTEWWDIRWPQWNQGPVLEEQRKQLGAVVVPRYLMPNDQ